MEWRCSSFPWHSIGLQQSTLRARLWPPRGWAARRHLKSTRPQFVFDNSLFGHSLPTQSYGALTGYQSPASPLKYHDHFRRSESRTSSSASQLDCTQLLMRSCAWRVVGFVVGGACDEFGLVQNRRNFSLLGMGGEAPCSLANRRISHVH